MIRISVSVMEHVDDISQLWRTTVQKKDFLHICNFIVHTSGKTTIIMIARIEQKDFRIKNFKNSQCESLIKKSQRLLPIYLLTKPALLYIITWRTFNYGSKRT